MRIPTTRFLTATLCLAALSILNSIPAQTGCVAPPPGLVGWWRAEGNALDQTGVNDGLLEGPVSFAPAEVGKGFVFDGTNAYVKVPASPSLDVGPGPGFTVEGWIKPSDLSERPIVEWNSGLTTVPYGAHLWMSSSPPNGNGPGCLYANLTDTNQASHTIASAGGLLTTDSFQHVALTFSRTNGSAVLYLNGASVAQATLGSFVPKTDADFYLGTRIAGSAENHFWYGLMDEMTLYERALSATEIQAIYHAGSAGKCVTAGAPSITSEPLSQTVSPGATVTFDVAATGTPPLSYRWRMNTNIIAGATNASLTLTNVQPANAGGYSVIVSNLFGRATSSTAVLTVTLTNAAPLITKEPVGQTAAPGATVVFYVTATGAPPLSYRWLMNSNVIVAATNASLTLTNVQLANAGGYSVIVSNLFGRATSSTAVLTVTLTGAAPLITSEPASQTVAPGGTAIFYVAATGAPPLTYHWRMNTNIIAGATNASLMLTNVQFANAGGYSVIVTNAFGRATSSTALLTVSYPPALVQAAFASGIGSRAVTVPILLIANGNENALAFTLDFNPALLTYTNIVLGPGASNATLVFNAAQATNGLLGAGLALPASAVFKAGTQEVADVTFTLAVVTNLTYSTVGFGSQVTRFQVAGTNANPLPANFTAGYVRIAPTPFEGDVAPRPDGDEVVTVIDWVQEARFVAGLDVATNGSEFQRADCAPRSTLGDAAITIADWVQVGRYLVGLDPLTPAGGPTSPVVAIPGVLRMQKSPTAGPVPRAQSRQLQVQDALILEGQASTVSVTLEALGDENALGFSLSFDPASLTYTGAGAGSALSSAQGAMFLVNDTQAASGRLGFALGLPTGATFSSGGQQVATISFRAPSSASGSCPLALANEPVTCEVADALASALSVNYLNGTVLVTQPPTLSVALSELAIQLSWPRWATNFVLEEASGQLSPSLTWSRLGPAPAATTTANVVTLPLSTTNRFYRLRQR